MIKQIKKMLLDRGVVNVNNFAIEKKHSLDGKSLLVKAINLRDPNEVHTFKIEKIDVHKKTGLEYLIVNKNHQYMEQLISEINDRYELSISKDDIHNDRIRNKEPIVRISELSEQFTGTIKCKTYTEEDDLIAFFDGKCNITITPKKDSNTKYLFRHLDFTYMEDVLKDIPINTLVDDSVLNKILFRLVDFKVSEEKTKNNLRGCFVVSNESVNMSFTNASRCIKLGLNKKFCTAPIGIIELYY